ncbi:MAG: hemerythrin domain-containing protein [Pseudomonas marincola]
MHKSIKHLLEAHTKMFAVLAEFKHQFREFRLGKDLDYALIESILDYLNRSAQLNHHQAEDEMHQLLNSRYPVAISKLSDIPLEHERLFFLCDALKEALSDVARDAELPRMWLVSVAQEYENAQLRHMHMEEDVLFPLAEQYFTKEDWNEVRTRVSLGKNKEFASTEAADIEDLQQDIATWSDDKIHS